MSRKEMFFVALVVLGSAAVAALSVAAEPAVAASKIGDNVGKEVKSWGTALLLGTAALVGLPALAKRDVSQSMMIALIVIVLGGFIYADGTIKHAIHSIWTAIGG